MCAGETIVKGLIRAHVHSRTSSSGMKGDVETFWGGCSFSSSGIRIGVISGGRIVVMTRFARMSSTRLETQCGGYPISTTRPNSRTQALRLRGE